MHRIVVLLLTITLLALPIVNAQTIDPKIEKARQEATKLADGKSRADVKMKFGEKFTGHITSVERDTFNFTLKDTSNSKTIAFTDVDSIKKHKKVSTGSWIAIGAIAAGAVIVVVATCSIYSWKCR